MKQMMFSSRVCSPSVVGIVAGMVVVRNDGVRSGDGSASGSGTDGYQIEVEAGRKAGDGGVVAGGAEDAWGYRGELQCGGPE